MPNIGATTLANIRTAAAQRADQPTPTATTFVSLTEYLTLINASCQNLWDKLIEAYGEDYEVATAFSVTTDGANDHFALATDFYRLLGVDLLVSGTGASSIWVSLKRFNFSDRNRYNAASFILRLGQTNLRYRISGNNVWFAPFPPSGTVTRIWYAPRFTPLVNDGDSFDGFNGWEEWIVNDVALKILSKEESDMSGVQALQSVQNDRLASIMQNRDAGSPSTMIDMDASNGFGDSFGGGWPW